MLVIGLTGGIASGKSFVARCLAEMGAVVLDADRLGHEVLERPDVIKRIETIWPDVIDDSGSIDRSFLAKKVFGGSDNNALPILENITHPLIRERIEARLTELRSLDTAAVVLDVPLLLKSGWYKLCDKIVFISADLQDRKTRAAETRGWMEGELSRRESHQASLKEKRQVASDFIDNSQSKVETMNQVKQLWKKWGLETIVS